MREKKRKVSKRNSMWEYLSKKSIEREMSGADGGREARS